MEPRRSQSQVSLVFGLALVFLGALLFAGQFLRIEVWRFLWPLFVITPGAILLALAWTGSRQAGYLAVPGSIISMVGLILLYQSVTDHWASWAYAWLLIFPVSVGLGLMLQGSRTGSEPVRKSGADMARVGLIIFLLAAAFLEGLVGISGSAAGRTLAGAALVLLGVYLLIRPRKTSGRSAIQISESHAAASPATGEAPSAGSGPEEAQTDRQTQL